MLARDFETRADGERVADVDCDQSVCAGAAGGGDGGGDFGVFGRTGAIGEAGADGVTGGDVGGGADAARRPSLLLVGHEPHMSSFLGYLLGTPESRDFKKGAMVRVDLFDWRARGC